MKNRKLLLFFTLIAAGSLTFYQAWSAVAALALASLALLPASLLVGVYLAAWRE